MQESLQSSSSKKWIILSFIAFFVFTGSIFLSSHNSHTVIALESASSGIESLDGVKISQSTTTQAPVCHNTKTIKRYVEYECGPNACQSGTCVKGTTKTETELIPCSSGESCSGGACFPDCTWETTSTTRQDKTCTNSTTASTQTQTQERCGPSNCVAGVCTKNALRWVDTGNPSTQVCTTTSQVCHNKNCITPPVCKYEKVGTPRYCKSRNTKVEEVHYKCGPDHCKGGTQCVAGLERVDTTETNCPAGKICSGGTCIDEPKRCFGTLVDRKEKSCSSDNKVIIKTMRRLVCGPLGCTGGYCTSDTKYGEFLLDTKITPCPDTYTCKNGVCEPPIPECAWIATGDTRDNKTCTSTTVASTQQEKEEECGPSNCINGGCTKGETRWVNSGSPTTQVCTTSQFCKDGECEDKICEWTDTITTQIVKTCINSLRTSVQTRTQQLCGPIGCIKGTCTDRTTQWVNTGSPTTQNCTNGYTCNTTTGECDIPPVCKWEDTGNTKDVKTCSNPRTQQIDAQKEQRCGPAHCQGGTECTKGETQWITTGTTTPQCPNYGLCKDDGTGAICVPPPACHPTLDSYKVTPGDQCRIVKTCNADNSIASTSKECPETCGPTNCQNTNTNGSTCPSAGQVNWRTITTTSVNCKNNGFICKDGEGCVNPACTWTDTGEKRDNKTCINTQTEQTQKQKEQECGPSNCQQTATSCTKGDTRWIGDPDAVNPSPRTCPTQQTCIDGQCKIPDCRYTPNPTTRECDPNNPSTVIIKTSETCGPPGCTSGSCVAGHTKPITSTPHNCATNKVCHNGTCKEKKAPVLKNFLATVDASERQCTVAVKLTWNRDLFAGAKQKAYEIEISEDNFATILYTIQAETPAKTLPLDVETNPKQNQSRDEYQLAFDETYYARIKIQDTYDQWSLTSNIVTFKTPPHRNPKMQIQVPSSIEVGTVFTVTAQEVEVPTAALLNYEWYIKEKDTQRTVTNEIIQSGQATPSIDVLLPGPEAYTISLRTRDFNIPTTPDNTGGCSTSLDISTDSTLNSEFPRYEEVPATVN